VGHSEPDFPAEHLDPGSGGRDARDARWSAASHPVRPQATARPPTFVLFTTGFLEAGYRRFLERRLRETFDFEVQPDPHQRASAREAGSEASLGGGCIIEPLAMPLDSVILPATITKAPSSGFAVHRPYARLFAYSSRFVCIVTVTVSADPVILLRFFDVVDTLPPRPLLTTAQEDCAQRLRETIRQVSSRAEGRFDG
jgi:hypothetical protein